MHHYLMFESEFDRLKDYFLLESKDTSDNYDDLEEGSNEESGDTDKEYDSSKPAGKYGD